MLGLFLIGQGVPRGSIHGQLMSARTLCERAPITTLSVKVFQNATAAALDADAPNANKYNRLRGEGPRRGAIQFRGNSRPTGPRALDCVN